MTIWSKLISEGTISFSDIESIEDKISEIETATELLLIDISSICNRSTVSFIERAIALKTKGVDHKSPYEAINQLLHYWHCMVAAKMLIKIGGENIKVTGGAENSGQSADVMANLKNKKKILGEVYCVSEALWPTKTSKTIKKINSEDADYKFILFNLEAKPEYISKSENIAFYGVNRNSQSINLLCHKFDGVQTEPEVNLSGLY